MQNKKQINRDQERDPLLTFLGIFFIAGTVALIMVTVYFMSTSNLL